MTNPGGMEPGAGNEVIANVSVNVPPDASANLTQLRQSIDAVTAAMQASARASGDFGEFLAKLPEITTRVGQAQANLTAALQSGQQTMRAAQQGGGALGGPQGTAAPQQFVAPFAQGSPLGTGTGRISDPAAAQTYLNDMQQSDPRLRAAWMSARGLPVSPQELAQASTAPAPAPSVQVPGGTPPTSQRASSAPPDNSGAPTAIPQNVVGRASAEPASGIMSPIEQATSSLLNEAGVSLPPMENGYATFGGGGGQRPGVGPANPGVVGGGNPLGDVPLVGTLVGLATAGYKMTQTVGEQLTRMNQLGSVQGGGVAEGFQHEMSIKAMAMSPFLTEEQSRSIYQTALRSGYSGKTFDNLKDFMVNNLTELNIAAADSMKMFENAQRAGLKDANEAIAFTQKQMNAMKEDIKGSHMSLPTYSARVAEMEQLLVSAGVDQPQAALQAKQMAMAGGMNPTRAGDMFNLQTGIMSSPQAMRGVLAMTGGGANVAYGMEGRHVGPQDIWTAIRRIARSVAANSRGQDQEHQVSNFMLQVQGLLGQQLTTDEAFYYYEWALSNDPNPPDTPKNKDAATFQRNADNASGTGPGGLVSKGRPPGGILGYLTGPLLGPAGTMAANFGIDFLKNKFFGGGGARNDGPGQDQDAQAQQLPDPNTPGAQTSARVPRMDQHPVSDVPGAREPEKVVQASTRERIIETPSSSRVSGVLRIDADPRLAKALNLPGQVQLTANQINAYHGMGRATLNSPPPGDR